METNFKIVCRGFDVEDEKSFKGKGLEKLYLAKEEVCYLLNRGYKIKQATMFVANHYALTERQRLVLARSLAKDSEVSFRKEKMNFDLVGKEVYIDGFNAIIPLESMLSESILIECMDGAIRDLANLKGSYRLIDKTPKAIHLLLSKLDELQVAKAYIYIDKPVSNSGRLKTLIREIAENYNVEVEIELLNAVDKSLYNKENVITGDCVVIDKSISWVPLYKMIVDDYAKENNVWLINMK